MLEIGFHCSVKPENILSVMEFEGVRVQMTWGGGMGGSTKAFYGLIGSTDEYEFNFEDLLQDEVIKLSRRYKVYEQPRKLIVVTIKNLDDWIERYVFALGINENYKFSYDFDSRIADKPYYGGKVRLLDIEDELKEKEKMAHEYLSNN